MAIMFITHTTLDIQAASVVPAGCQRCPSLMSDCIATGGEGTPGVLCGCWRVGAAGH